VKQKLALAARILLGLIFFVFGLNGFLHFIPMDKMPPMPEAAMAFMKSLGDSGYMIYLIKTVEVLGGAMLLTGFFVPLALLILAPGLYNIFLFHAFLAPGGLPLAITMVVLHSYLVYMHWGVFCGLLVAKPDMECCAHDHDHDHDHDHGHSHKHE
jgi:uncharacterized membrane protein YphA (DoxX/SURF4 family)